MPSAISQQSEHLFGKMNSKVFTKEAVFSIDIGAIHPEIKGILSNRIGRYNYIKGNVHFYFFKNDPNYPEMRLKVKRLGYEVKESEDLVWIKVEIPSFSNEKVKEQLTGEPFYKIENAIILPYVIVADGRMNFLIQYNDLSKETVTKRLMENIVAYSNVYWEGSFKIERISKIHLFEEHLDFLKVATTLTEVDVRIYRNKEVNPITEVESSSSAKWPSENGEEVRFTPLEKSFLEDGIRKDLIMDFLNRFIKRYFSALWMESVRYGDYTDYYLILESELAYHFIDIFDKFIGEGVEIQIVKVCNFPDQYSGNDSLPKHLNKELFQNELIFSIDLKKIIPDYFDALGNGLVYSDWETGRYTYSIMKTEERYGRLKMALRKVVKDIRETDEMSFIVFGPEELKMSELSQLLNGIPTTDLSAVISYPACIIRNGRLYNLVQFSDGDALEVTKRVTRLTVFNSLVGKGTFMIHKVGKARDIVDFFKDYGDALTMVELEVALPSNTVVEGIHKTYSKDARKVNFVVKTGDNVGTVSLSDALSYLEAPSEPILRAFEELTHLYSVNAYFEAKCNGKECRIVWLYESRFLGLIMKSLDKVIKDGIDLKLTRVERMLN